MNSPPTDYRWHLGLVDSPRTEHLALQGQSRRGDGHPWVWSVCGSIVHADPILKPIERGRCQACLVWLKAPDDEKPPPSRPEG